MTSWLLNFPNINLNIAEPIDEFVRYININYGEVFVAAKKMLSIFINGINGALDMIPWWLMILLVVFATKKLMNSYRNGVIYGGLLFMIGACGYWHMMNETLAIVITAVIFSLLIGLPIGIVQIPQALPTIMTGINQTMMMAVAMVVTCAMIGANGLGMEVLIAINRMESGRGIIAGFAIVIIAIIIDRLTQSLVQKEGK